MKKWRGIGRIFLIIIMFFPVSLEAESLRAFITGAAEVSLQSSGRVSISLSYTDSALILLDRDTRFFRAVELEFTAPQNYLVHRGSLAVALYTDLDRIPEPGVAELQVRQIFIEPIPNKIQSIYQIPLRQAHGLRTSPYATVLPDVISPSSFPVMFRVLPVIKGLHSEIESMRFTLQVRPILSDEGAVRLVPRYPENLQGRPFTVLIDDQVIENPNEEQLLREGDHHLVILSSDYRNENRVFKVERGKILELAIALQDPTPLVIFEAPKNALIFFDDQLIDFPEGPVPVTPGIHEVKFQLSDYSIMKSLVVQKGKTYRVSMEVDVQVSESD
jgi:hypothetical protein